MVKHLLAIVMLLSAAIFPLNAGEKQAAESDAARVAEVFINAYVRALDGEISGYTDAIQWVKSHPLASENFKTQLEALYTEALLDDPELGYGADAVLSAQDYPEAYRVISVAITGDRATVDLQAAVPDNEEDPAFPLRMILIRHGDSWLVDASGDLVREDLAQDHAENSAAH